VPLVPKPKNRADRAKYQERKNARDMEIKKRKEREQELFRGLLEHLKLNPADKVRIEAHVDDAVFPSEKGKKKKGTQDLQKLTIARARAISRLIASYGITGKNRIVVAGMGAALPKVPNTTKENRIVNNRIELVAYPPDVQVRNSLKLPLLADREKIIINVSYSSKAAGVKNLKIVERLPKGMQYVKGSGILRGAVREPQVQGDELRWQLGDPSGEYQETLSYVVKKSAGTAATINSAVRLAYTAGRQEETRDIDPLKPAKNGLTVPETCEKCHSDVMSMPFRHGPVDSGYCNLCHDPHGSDHSAWTRLRSWELCTTCHREKASDVHVIAGFVHGVSHPTRNVRDPLRPGRKLSCISCHSPHSAETKYLLAFGVTRETDLCGYCHKKK
ncbi:MAG: OmpA family protein, partial [Nitrospirota bacterium]|nr:OmpA family protein [Nitrospirota bacterium]